MISFSQNMIVYNISQTYGGNVTPFLEEDYKKLSHSIPLKDLTYLLATTPHKPPFI